MAAATAIAIANVAVAVVGAISGAGVDKAIAKANERSSKTAADTKNESRLWANVNTLAQNNLARFTQSVNNNRKLAAMGSSLDTAVTNYRRQKDQLLASNFEQSIQAAEQAGSQHASAAVAGVTGSVVDNINSATVLKQDRMQALADQNTKSFDYDFQNKQRAIVAGSLNDLDQRNVFDNLDNNIDVALKFASPTWFGKFLGMGGAQATGQAAKTFFSTSDGQQPSGGSTFWSSGGSYSSNNVIGDAQAGA